MSALLITRGESSTLPSTKKDGKIYITTDTHKIYIDNGTTRFEIDAKYADALKNTLKLVLDGDAAGEISFDGSEGTVTLDVSIDKLSELENAINALPNAASNGIEIVDKTIKHTNNITAGTAKGSSSKTLEFGGTFTIPSITYDAQGHIKSKSTTTMTMPANPNTDTKVTEVGNHYDPAMDSAVTISVDAADTESVVEWDTTNFITGIDVERDAKGHVTGVKVDSVKMLSNPNEDKYVKQGHSTTGNYRTLLLSYKSGATYGEDQGEATNVAYYNEKIAACPETGEIKASSFTGPLNGNATSATRVALSDGSNNAERKIVVCGNTSSGQNLYTVNGVTANYANKSLTATTFIGELNGNAKTATALQTPRTIQTNLGSSTGANFDGSVNISPGVSGVLPVKHGGTNANSRAQAASNIMGGGTKNGDFNENLSTGVYWVQIASCTNSPIDGTGGYGYLEVLNPWSGNTSVSSEDAALQRFTRYSNGQCWVRSKINGVWTSWAVQDPSQYLPLAGGKLTGKLTIGNSSTNSPPSTGIHVHDLRDATITANSFGDQNVNFYFAQEVNGDWKSIMSVKGWTGSYATWQIAGQASNSANVTDSLYFRTGLGSSWNDWHTVLDSQNYTSYCAKASHSHNYLPLTGGTLTGNLVVDKATASVKTKGTNGEIGLHVSTNSGVYDFAQEKWIIATDKARTKVYSGYPIYGAVWNDYAEFRKQDETIKPGYCATSTKDGKVKLTTERMQYCEGIVSDTFGFSIGETTECKTPLAVSGRVLAYYSGSIDEYEIGDVLCANFDGTVCKMTREEIKEYPDRIVGTVSEIPTYETWGDGNVSTENRIWVKIK